MRRSYFAAAAVLYALTIAYASTVVGPVGMNFVPIDPAEALRQLTHIPYVENGSDQRSDWMGNVLMLVPFGFLVMGTLSPRRRGAILAAAAAGVLCFAFILLVKYTQLFFPPRTVTLNYVIAQGLGALVGIVLFGALRVSLTHVRRDRDQLEILSLILRCYTGLLLVFLLMPLDFALSPGDLLALLDRVPDSFTAIVGEGRPLLVRLAVIAGSTVAMAPIGAMLTLVNRGRIYVGRGVSDATWIGFCISAGVYALSCLLLSGSPSLAAIAYRTLGVTLGAWVMHWLTWRDPETVKRSLARLVPWMTAPYVLLVAGVNGLLSLTWQSAADGARDFYIYGLIPLFNYYIVTKPQAAKNIVAHVVMYAPIGVMIWLRAKPRGGGVAAFVLAMLLSAVVETGRFFRPELVPDINAVPLAGIAALGTLLVMPPIWRMVSAVAIRAVMGTPLSRPAASGRETSSPQTSGIAPARDDIEDY